jgi:hypothetical protein
MNEVELVSLEDKDIDEIVEAFKKIGWNKPKKQGKTRGQVSALRAKSYHGFIILENFLFLKIFCT